MAGILFLDLSFSGTGWALLRSPSEKPVSGVWPLKSGLNSNAEVFHKLRSNLRDLIGMERPVLLGFEAPRPPTGRDGKTTMATIYKLIGLCAVAEEVAHAHGVQKIQSCHVQTIRKHFCGSGFAKKDKVMQTCRDLGWSFIDDNAADALAGVHFLANQQGVEGFEHTPGTLFSRRAP